MNLFNLFKLKPKPAPGHGYHPEFKNETMLILRLGGSS
jgi:hypothetical protein